MQTQKVKFGVDLVSENRIVAGSVVCDAECEGQKLVLALSPRTALVVCYGCCV